MADIRVVCCESSARQQVPARSKERQDRRWLIGHAVELANSKIDLGKMRADTARHAPAANVASKRLFNDWLDAL